MYIAGPTNTGDGGISRGWSSAPRTDCHPALKRAIIHLLRLAIERACCQMLRPSQTILRAQFRERQCSFSKSRRGNTCFEK
jgi:hypothetical protein